MGNPIIFLKEDKTVLTHAGITPENELQWLKDVDIRQLINVDGPSVVSSPQIPGTGRCIIDKYSFSENSMRIIICLEKNSFTPSTDLLLMEEICSALNTTRRLTRQHVLDNQIESILYRLYSGETVHAEALAQKLHDLGWKQEDKYYLLLIENSNGECTFSEINELEHILAVRLYHFENYIAALLHSRKDIELSHHDLIELEQYFHEHNLTAGLSYGFFNITELLDARKQAEFAISLIQMKLSEQNLYLFGDGVVSYLCITSNDSHGLDYEGLSHPYVKKIVDYDCEYGTDYLNFLAAYVFSGMSVKRTSEALFIHRNTVYQRVGKLKELFNIDFTDLYLYIKLYVSLTALSVKKTKDSVDTSIFHLWMT